MIEANGLPLSQTSNHFYYSSTSRFYYRISSTMSFAIRLSGHKATNKLIDWTFLRVMYAFIWNHVVELDVAADTVIKAVIGANTNLLSKLLPRVYQLLWCLRRWSCCVPRTVKRKPWSSHWRTQNVSKCLVHFRVTWLKTARYLEQQQEQSAEKHN